MSPLCGHPGCGALKTNLLHMETKTPELPHIPDTANIDLARSEGPECVVNNPFIELDLY